MLMKKMFKSLLMSALVLTAGAFVACSDKGEEETKFEGMPEISVEANATGVTLEGGVVTIDVTSNAPWTAEVDAADVTLSKKSGNGNAKVNVTIPAATAARDIKVTFTAVGWMMGQEIPVPAEVSITQNATGKLMISGVTPEVVGSGKEFSFENVLVVATGSKAYVIADQSGAMVVYHADHGRTVGEKINISGQVTIFTKDTGSFGTPQFSSSATVEVVSTGNEVAHNPEVVSGASFDALTDNKIAKEVELIGNWVVSGNYVNITDIEGAAKQGSIQYINNADYSQFDGKTVLIKGYYVGLSVSGSTNYVNIMPYSVEADPNSPDLNVGKKELVFKADDDANARQIFTVTTNGLEGYELTWAIDNDTDFTLGKQLGNPSRTTLYVTPKAANTGSVKSANITITYTNGTKTRTENVKVIQESNSAANATFDMNALYGSQERATEVGTKTVDGITIKWDKGENNNAAKIYDGVVRAYSTNSFTLEGATITNVEVVYGAGQGTNTVSTDAGTYTEATDLLSGVWKGSASSVKFTVDKTADGKVSGQRRVSKIVVTYQK